MAPKKNNQKANNPKSKEEKRLEQYLNHPANVAAQEKNNNEQQSNKQNNKKAGKNNKAPEPAQNEQENEIAALLKEVNIDLPLPDFTPLDDTIKSLKTTLEQTDSLIANIASNNAEALGQPPVEEEESGFKNAQLTPDIIQKRDQIIKDVKKTIETYEQKRQRVNDLLKQENMSDVSEQLAILNQNLELDQKYKEQILALF